MQGKKIVFFELNEVPYKVFDHFCALMPQSSITKLRKRSRSYETLAEDTGHLSPWVTWPSLHRGVTNEQHEITDFGMDLTKVDNEFAPIWKMLSAMGVKTGVFGSLHSYPLPANVSDYSFFVPDTFAAGYECFPAKYEAFQRFNLAMAGINGRNVNAGIAFKEAANFLRAAPGLGLRGRTAMNLALQLGSERLNRDRVVRRRTSQMQIAFDFYLAALKSEQPAISFFFTNHVASSLHRYWPALFPADYKAKNFDDAWITSWQGEIPFAMHEAEHQIGQLMKFVEEASGYVLVVGTSMGQAAVEGTAKVNSQVVVSNLARFTSFLGLQKDDWQKRPAMSPQYVLALRPEKKKDVLDKLEALSVNGKKFTVTDLGSDVLRIELSLTNAEDIEVIFRGNKIDPKSAGIQNINLQDAAGANAYHIPNGMLMVYDPADGLRQQAAGTSQISTLEVAPSILRNFGIERPSYMRGALQL